MLKTKVPPPVYMLAMACLMWSLDRYFSVYHWLGSPWNRVGLVIVVASMLLDVWSLRLFFGAKTTFNPMKPDSTRYLVITGPYRISRNPMYLGLLVMLTGWALYLGSVSPLSALPLFVWILTRQQIEPEESILADKFGQQYEDYKRRVRRWI